MTYVLTADNLTGQIKRYLYHSNDAEGYKYFAQEWEVVNSGKKSW